MIFKLFCVYVHLKFLLLFNERQRGISKYSQLLFKCVKAIHVFTTIDIVCWRATIQHPCLLRNKYVLSTSWIKANSWKYVLLVNRRATSTTLGYFLSRNVSLPLENSYMKFSLKYTVPRQLKGVSLDPTKRKGRLTRHGSPVPRQFRPWWFFDFGFSKTLNSDLQYLIIFFYITGTAMLPAPGYPAEHNYSTLMIYSIFQGT